MKWPPLLSSCRHLLAVPTRVLLLFLPLAYWLFYIVFAKRQITFMVATFRIHCHLQHFTSFFSRPYAIWTDSSQNLTLPFSPSLSLVQTRMRWSYPPVTMIWGEPGWNCAAYTKHGCGKSLMDEVIITFVSQHLLRYNYIIQSFVLK